MNSPGLTALLMIAAHLGADPNAPATASEDAKGTRAIITVIDEGQLRAVRRAMSSKITVDYDATPLQDVLREFHEKSQLNFHPDPKVESIHGLDVPNLPVTLQAREISLHSALNIILRDHDLRWFFRDGVVVIAHKSLALVTMQACVFDVADLLLAADATDSREADASSLINVITDTIAQMTWSKVGGRGSIQFEPGTSVLVVAQAWEVLEQVEALLAKLRESNRRQQDAWAAGRAKDVRVALYRLPSELHDPLLSWVLTNVAKTDQPDELRIRAQILENAISIPHKVAEIIPQMVEPDSWREKGGEGVIFAVGGALIVRQTERVHAVLTRLFKQPKPNPVYGGSS